MRVSLLSCAAALLLAAGCGSAARSSAPSAQSLRTAFAGSPPALASLHAQANRLLPSSPGAFKSVLASLQGHPVVVNKWGSWCGPCRAEFPAFQRASAQRGRSVAFLGLDGGDNRGDASTFLKQFPVSYPSYEDPGAHIAFALNAGSYYPTTLFYDARGHLAFLHAGPYASAAALEADIARYLHA